LSVFTKKYEMSWNKSSLLAVHTSLVNKTRRRFDMPEFVKLISISMRKHVQIVFFAAEVSEWEKISLQKYGNPHAYQEHRKLFIDTAQHHYLPNLEAYYRCTVDHFYLFNSHFKYSFMYSFSVKFFSSPLFRQIDPYQTPVEEKLASSFSLRLRLQNGRGPAKVTVSVLDNRFIVFESIGVLSIFFQDYINKNPESTQMAIDMITDLITDAVNFAFQECYQEPFSESFLEVDLINNRVVGLFVRDPLNEVDFSSADL